MFAEEAREKPPSLDAVQMGFVDTRACAWREAFPDGALYGLLIFDELSEWRMAGRLTGMQAAHLVVAVVRFVIGETERVLSPSGWLETPQGYDIESNSHTVDTVLAELFMRSWRCLACGLRTRNPPHFCPA